MLRVLIARAGEYWTAQALEIDYAVSALSIDELQRSFEWGLGKTIEGHWQRFGHLDNLLKPAPSEFWLQIARGGWIESRSSPVDPALRCPFGTIMYFQARKNP